jgi:hypothetical protein
MSLAHESVRIYFPKEISEYPIVIGCVRKNGDTCIQTSDLANRYFQTESGNKVAMLPEELGINFS